MISKFRKFFKGANQSSRELLHNSKKSDDIYAMAILQPLLNNQPYLPFNGGALRPICIAYILNEIIINNRKTILEFGCGLSTIMMARMLKRNNISATIHSVEHNSTWAGIVQNYLDQEGLQNFVTLIHTDLVPFETPVGTVNGYDISKVKTEVNGKRFDLIIVDGPPAYLKTTRHSRFPVLLNINSFVSDDFCVILDDVNREGEQTIINHVRENNKGLKYSTLSKTMGIFKKHESFNPLPIHY
ncbi:MAG: class I SAM-dependent methyltransferase [Flavobacterium sp.]|nr:class I SAM-dependent methyltransferase [Flavobacterium sp.]